MEGRRLTNLLAHLSSGSSWNSAARLDGSAPDLSRCVTSRTTCNESVRVSESLPLPAAEPVEAHYAQMCTFESRFSEFMKETSLKGSISHAVTSSTSEEKEAEIRASSILHQTTSLQQIARDSILQRSERPFSHDKTSIKGCGGSRTSSWSQTSTLGARKCEGSLQCKSLDLAEVAIRESPIEQTNQMVYFTDKDLLSHRIEGNDHEARDCEYQTSAKATNNSDCQVHQTHLSEKDMHTAGSHSTGIESGTSESTTLSRNNVMTGPRSLIVDDCIFCLIVQGQSPAFKLYEDDMCVCILDVHPLSHGHSLLIPKAHFPCLERTPPEVAAAMCAIVPLLSMAIMQATSCDSFNLLVNSGKAAGQVVFHTHFHIIPRRSGDNLWRSEDSNRRALPAGHETSFLVQQIQHHLSKPHS